ncbi:MAG: pentapeptide repeat-containing protein, partial [Methylocella sp.]
MSDQGKALVEKAYDLDEIRKIFEDAGTLSGGVWLGYLLVFFYIGSAVLGVTPRDLLLENPVKLPFLNTELPLVAFFFLAPILFLISHVYALAHFAMVAMKARYFDDELAARLRDEDDIKERVRWLLPSSVFVQFLAGPSYIRKGGVGWLLKAIAWITLVFGPLVLLLMIQVRFLPYHLLSATNTHRFAIMFDFAALAWLWPIVLAGRSETNWPVGWYVPAWSLAYAGTAFLLLTFSFPGEPGVHWFRRGRFYDFLFKGDVFDPATGYPTSIFSNLLVLPEFDALDAAKIDDPKKLDFVKRTMNLRGRHLEGANFGDADLRKVDLSRAYLQGARFVDARLQGAVLRDAKLQGATLDGAKLQGASLDFASLQGASLDDAQLQGASLGGTNLQGASLQGAKLQGASLQAA